LALKEKLELISSVVKEAGLIDEIEPAEILSLASDIGSDDYHKIIKTVLYVRKRFIERRGRVESFKYAFPEMCVVTDPNKAREWGVNKNEGDELSKSSIEIKAKRLENSKIYKSIVALLTTSTYTMFALERIKVLELVTKKIFSDKMSERDRAKYVEIFLNETRKPQDDKGIEVNIDLRNNSDITEINDKLDKIASKLQGVSADKIIELVAKEK